MSQNTNADDALQAPTVPAQDTENKNIVSEIDYKAKAAELEKELGQAQHKIVELKRDNKDKSEPDTIDISKVVQETVANALAEDRTLRVGEIFEDVLSGISANEDERKLIKMIYDNKIVKSGMSRQEIQNDLETAKIIANAPKIHAQNKELANAAINKPGVNSAGGQGGGSFESDSPDAVSINDAERALLAAYNIDPSKVRKN